MNILIYKINILTNGMGIDLCEPFLFSYIELDKQIQGT